jgi:hypothetical protein
MTSNHAPTVVVDRIRSPSAIETLLALDMFKSISSPSKIHASQDIPLNVAVGRLALHVAPLRHGDITSNDSLDFRAKQPSKCTAIRACFAYIFASQINKEPQ